MNDDTPKIIGAPDVIYLIYGDIEEDCTHEECSVADCVSWCEDSQFDSDVAYVREELFDEMKAQRDEYARQVRELLSRLS